MEKISSNEIIRNNVRYYRIVNGYTQEKLSELMGINEKHYNRLENGINKFTIDTLDLVADILKKEPWELLKENHTKDEVPSRLDFYNNKQKLQK